MIQLTNRELGAVLAGLRMYQDIREKCEYVGGKDFSFREYYDIATDGGSFRALDHPEVDDLCERLNTDSRSHLSPEFLAGVRTGVAALKEGRITPWEDVERELFG